MNTVDYIILGLIILSVGAGFVRGFFKEAISLGTWVVAIIVALKFGYLLSGFFSGYFESPVLQLWSGRVLMFVAVVIAGTLLNHLINALLDRAGLSFTDHMLGMLFGLLRGVVFSGVLIMLGQGLALDREQWWQDSRVIPYVAPVTGFISDWFSHGMDLVEDVQVRVATPSAERLG